ncbi:MAG: endonuclease/exonuclease/phosphatase family protein [Planctomycetia bacterium]|nr:endonuclease/exonuclease/phosphatase family protein [Planctomycetia bacterium]
MSGRRMPLGARILLASVAIAGTGVLAWKLWRLPRGRYAERFSGNWSLPATSLTVVTYNVEFGNRLPEAIEVIRRERPDVVCLQEIREAQLPALERELGMSGVWWGSFNLFGGGEWGNVVLSRGKVLEAHSIPGAPAGSFGVWAAVELDGARFVVGSVHLMHMKTDGAGFAAREREIRSLLAAIDAAGAPALIAGAFNNPPLGGNYDLLTGRLIDLSAGSGATLPNPIPLLRVDYVFGTREWSAETARRIDSKVSDHRPVVAVVRSRR